MMSIDKVLVAAGDEITVQLLKKLYNKDGAVDLDKYRKAAVSVAAFLKQLCLEWPDPLLTKRLAATFLKTHGTPRSLARSLFSLRSYVDMYLPVRESGSREAAAVLAQTCERAARCAQSDASHPLGAF